MLKYIDYNKMLTTRVYNSESILVDKRKATQPVVEVVLGDFEQSYHMFKVLPNTAFRLYTPDFKYNILSHRVQRSSSLRNDFYKEIEPLRIRYNKLLKLDKIDQFSDKLIILNGESFRETFNEFARVNKRSSLSLLSLLQQMLTGIFKEVGLKNKNIRLTLPVEDDAFSKTILFAFTSNNKQFIQFLADYRVVFTHQGSPIGTILYRPLIDLKEVSRVKRILNTLMSFNTISGETGPQAAKNALGADLFILDVKPDPEVEKELSKEPALEKEEEETSIEVPSDNEEEAPLEVQPETTDEEPPVENIDLSDIVNASTNTNVEDEQAKKAREDFLSSMMKHQEKALAKEEEYVKSLPKDTQLKDSYIADDNILNEEIRKNSFSSLTQQYYTQHYRRDLLNIVKSLNDDPEFPAVVIGYDLVDTSDALSKKQELSVTYVDINHKKHNFKVDIPTLSHDGFLYINGNKQFIAKQATLLPVIKETEDRVQITTNYRKAFLYRKGDKINSTIDLVLKAFQSLPQDTKVKIQLGNSASTNNKYDVSLSYNYLAKKLFKVTVPSSLFASSWMDLVFNQEYAKDLIPNEKRNIVAIYYSSDKITGYDVEDLESRLVIKVDPKGKETSTDKSYTEYMVDLITTNNNYIFTDIRDSFLSRKPSRSLAFTEVKIVSNSFFLGPLVAFFTGLLPLLDKAKIKYSFEEKRRAKKDSESMLVFKDGYLYMDSGYLVENELLLNGLTMGLNPTDYTLAEAYRLSPLFTDYFFEVTKNYNTGKALLNFEASMIDPITKEVLKELKLPENFVDLLLYGNYLLRDLKKSRKNDLSHFRIRDSETISAVVYNSLADAFANYKRTVRSGSPQPISVAKDDVMKRIVTGTPNVEGYSTLNPFLEAEIKAKSTFKGVSGTNSSDAYTPDFRAYHESMLGLYGIYTPIGPEVGVNRSLTMKPRYDNVRGYLKPLDLDKAGAANLFSIGEMLNVFTPKHADAPRVVMASVQGKHLTPTVKQSPYLVGSGVDKALAHMLGQDFAYKAQEDGVVEKVDTSKNLVTLRYKDGTLGVIDISAKPAKNSGGGFYIENKLTPIKELKVGFKFKKGTILAKDENFFNEMADGSTGFAAGRLTKIALLPLPETFEDSSVVTQRLVDEMASYVINKRDLNLKKNSRIISMKDIGDEVTTNTPLIVYEEVGNSESSVLDSLEKLDNSTKDLVSEIARSVIKAKYTGKIVDMKIYYNCDLEDMHPSLAKVVQAYINKYDAKAKVIEKGRSNEIVQMPSTAKINSTKIAGQEIEGVVIEYYIRHFDTMDVGSKVTAFTSLKTIIAETIPEGQEPFSEYGGEEDQVDFMLSPMSLISRMVSDFYLLGYTNKLLINLKNQCIDILEEE